MYYLIITENISKNCIPLQLKANTKIEQKWKEELKDLHQLSHFLYPSKKDFNSFISFFGYKILIYNSVIFYMYFIITNNKIYIYI